MWKIKVGLKRDRKDIKKYFYDQIKDCGKTSTESKIQSINTQLEMIKVTYQTSKEILLKKKR